MYISKIHSPILPKTISPPLFAASAIRLTNSVRFITRLMLPNETSVDGLYNVAKQVQAVLAVIDWGTG